MDVPSQAAGAPVDERTGAHDYSQHPPIVPLLFLEQIMPELAGPPASRYLRIALIGDYNATVVAHQAIPRALSLAAHAVGVRVDGCWIGTDRIADAPESLLDAFDAFWCVPASPYRSMDGALQAIRHAREAGSPFLGTCGGFQHAIIEFARNVLGNRAATLGEIDAGSSEQYVSQLSCSLVEVTAPITVSRGTKLFDAYQSERIEEGYHCNYGLNENRRAELERGGIRFSAFADDGSVRGFELTDHPFFVCTLFQPERAALRGEICTPAVSLVRAATQNSARALEA